MSMEVEGIGSSILFLEGIGKGVYMKRPLLKYGVNIRRTTAPYAPARDPSWERSGNLGRSWWTRADHQKVVVGNKAPYSGYVQQEATQVSWHKQTGWRTVEGSAEKLLPQLNKDIDAEIKRLDRATGTN